ncbi:MAG: CPBP family intramembrane metalloprotease [Polyangiaceae bacterium]|nr:CPBP family intramembrane metalloprotease [Polyangiaceae bacterium]
MPARPRLLDPSTPSGIAALVAATTVGVTALSYALPADYAATGVAFAFLFATYGVAVPRDDAEALRSHGLALGGLAEPHALDARRMARETVRAMAWALGLAALVLPPFWIGWVYWWRPAAPFVPAPPPPLLDEVLGQVLVIALPEEAFYRGWLQTAIDRVYPPRWRVLGARLGPSLLLASAVFAAGHVLTETHPNRLAVFFPALLFGWLRARTGGIGASLAFHAACNLFAAWVARSYGLGG